VTYTVDYLTILLLVFSVIFVSLLRKYLNLQTASFSGVVSRPITFTYTQLTQDYSFNICYRMADKVH